MPRHRVLEATQKQQEQYEDHIKEEVEDRYRQDARDLVDQEISDRMDQWRLDRYQELLNEADDQLESEQGEKLDEVRDSVWIDLEDELDGLRETIVEAVRRDTPMEVFIRRQRCVPDRQSEVVPAGV